MTPNPVDAKKRLLAELEAADIEAYNYEATKELMQSWCMNVADNLEIARQAPDAKSLLDSGRRKSDDAVVIGAAPNLTWDAVDALKGFKGDIFCCNKSLKKCLANGVVPDYVLLVDSNPISRAQFADLLVDAPALRETAFLVSTTVHPLTVKYLKNALKARIFMFNPHTENGGQMPISTMWEWMNERQVIETGGSVGTFGFKAAKMSGHERVGLLGFQFYETPAPSWSKERVREYEMLYYPDADAYAAMSRGYKAYLTFIYEEMRGEHISIKNLSRGLVLDRCPFMESMTVEDFVRGKQ